MPCTLGWVPIAVAFAWMWPILTPAGVDRVAGEPDAAKACVKECPSFISKEIPFHLLRSYKNNTCRGKMSVLLTTQRNKEICADPREDWVQNAMRQLDAQKAGTPMPKKPADVQKHSGDAASRSGQTVGQVGHLSSMTTSGSLRDVLMTTLLGGDLGETHHQMTSHTTDSTSIVHGRQPVETLGPSTSKRLSSDPMEENMRSSVTSSPLLIFSTTVLSTYNVESSSQRTPCPTTVAKIKDFVGQLSTRSEAGERRGDSVSVKEGEGATENPTVVSKGDLVDPLPTDGTRELSPNLPTTLPTSDCHQENPSKGQDMTKTPEVASNAHSFLSDHKTGISLVVFGSILVILLATAVWAYPHHRAKLSSQPLARGLRYSPVYAHGEEYSMESL